MNKLEKLIDEGQKLSVTIKTDRIGAIAGFAGYIVDDKPAYYTWLYKTKLFLDQHFYGNRLVAEFIGKSESVSLENHVQLVAILKALLNEYEEEPDVNEQLAKLEKLKEIYESVMYEDESFEPKFLIKCFHDWYKAAIKMFYSFIGENDEVFVRFQTADVSGNCYVLSRVYHSLQADYVVLIEKVKQIASNKLSSPIITYNRVLQMNPKKKKIFISYSHEDKLYFDKLMKHLKVLRRFNNQYEVWTDQNLKTGDKWKERIENALDEASVAFLLVSTNFLASDFVMDVEVSKLLKKSNEEGTLILPIIISPCMFEESALSDYQAANSPQKPLDSMSESDQERELVNVMKQLHYLINE